MCESNNLLEPLIDVIWDCSKIIYRKITQKEIKKLYLSN